jgi:hypothetical protein
VRLKNLTPPINKTCTTIMPTIAEILAAKQAAATTTTTPPANNESQPRMTLAERAAKAKEDAEVKAAIDRIDPPGKREAAAARKAAATGIVLSQEMPVPKGENRGQATPIKGPEDIAPRSLGATEGETIDVTPLHADEAIKDWHKAVNAFSTDLVIMRDPVDPERAWLAVRLEEDPRHPLLIKDLPIYEHPMARKDPF